MNVSLTPVRFLRRAERLFGGNLGVVCGPIRLTYREFADRIDRLSRVLLDRGVQRGDRVAFLTQNCHRLLEAYFGVVQIGAILVPLNIRLSEDELVYILRDAMPKMLFYHSDFQATVSANRGRGSSILDCVQLDPGAEGGGKAEQTYDQLLEASSPARIDWTTLDENAAAEIFYSSGTTAHPKGVVLTHRNLYLLGLNDLLVLPLEEDDVHLHTIALFHVNGWGSPQCVTNQGGRHVIPQKFDVQLWLELIQRERVTSMFLVPTMAAGLLNYRGLSNYDVSSLRRIIVGGAPTTPELIRALETSFGCACYAGYGLTETAPTLSLGLLRGDLVGISDDELKYQVQASAGFEVPGIELRVVREDGLDVARDGKEVGEIIARGDMVMQGYWNQPEETARVFKDGWFRTGDLGTIDERRYIRVVDRLKDMILSGGENIASAEIERVLYLHPAILEAAVIAIPDEDWGEVPHALVVLKAGERAQAEEIIVHCRQYLGGYKVPKSIQFLDALPKGGTGKVLKRVLREPFWRSQQRKVH